MGPADESPMTEIFDERPAALDVGRHAGNDDEELACLGGIRISQHRRARILRFPELAVFWGAKTSHTRGADLRTRRQRRRRSQRSAQVSASFGNRAKAFFQVNFYFDGMASRNPLVSRRVEMLSGTALKRTPASVCVSDYAAGPTRRDMLVAPFLAALPLLLLDATARAGRIDPAETAITPSDAIKWSAWSGGPPHSGEVATLYGGLDMPGPYLVLMKWNPGYMSAPHSYATDRLSLVLSGTWWVNSGADFDPDNAVAVSAGGFVRRLARTPHYDGVKRGAKEPAVIALFGIAPVKFELVDPGGPAWRQV
jgi:hypothetical protein